MSIELAKQFCAITNSEQTFKRVLLNISGALLESKPNQKEKFNEVLQLAMPEIMEGTYEIYSNIYSSEELQQLIDFRNTPVGKKEIEYRELIEFKGGKIMEAALTKAMKNLDLI